MTASSIKLTKYLSNYYLFIVAIVSVKPKNQLTNESENSGKNIVVYSVQTRGGLEGSRLKLKLFPYPVVLCVRACVTITCESTRRPKDREKEWFESDAGNF